MALAALDRPTRTLAAVLHDLGDIPPDRIHFPAGNATEDDVTRLFDGDERHICELVNGFLVEKTMGYREALIAGIIVQCLNDFVRPRELGIVLPADGPIRVAFGRIRFPDVCFIPADRFPEGELPDDAICGAIPDLAVEVLSRGNTKEELKQKLHDYFAVGVRLVWYVHPNTKSADVYTSPTRKKEIGPGGSLDGGKVLPGFTLPLASVFAVLKNRKKT